MEARAQDIMNPDSALRFRLWRLRDALRDRLRGTAHRRDVFTRIYASNLWGDQESVSGHGSSLDATAVVRRELPVLFERFGVRSVLDAPCGDFLWMQDIVGALDSYVGVDIVPDLIEKNRARYQIDHVTFRCADISVDPLPRADLVLCRDCLIHLPTRLIANALRNFCSSGARYLLLTNSRTSAPYRDIPVGSFREIDVQAAPFRFPEPLWTIAENPTGSRALCLWELTALRDILDSLPQ